MPDNIMITGCVIAKNDEETLGKCLASLACVADQIIYVDTGSEDKCISIAHGFTNEIYSFNWVDDFSVARNYALDHVKGKWVVFLDADEYLEAEPDLLRARLAVENSEAVRCSHYNIGFEIQGKPVEGIVARIFRGVPEIRYKRPIHEYLFKKDGCISYSDYHDKIKIFHTGYSKETMCKKDKYFRNISMLLKELSKDPLDSELNFYLADMYRITGEWNKALFHLDMALESNCYRVPEYLPLSKSSRIFSMFKSGLYADADILKDIDLYLAENLENAELLACRGLILGRMGNLIEAELWLGRSRYAHKTSPFTAYLYHDINTEISSILGPTYR